MSSIKIFSLGRVRGYTLEAHFPSESAAVIHLPEGATPPGCFEFLFQVSALHRSG
jgi:hypothetical protein